MKHISIIFIVNLASLLLVSACGVDEQSISETPGEQKSIATSKPGDSHGSESNIDNDASNSEQAVTSPSVNSQVTPAVIPPTMKPISTPIPTPTLTVTPEPEPTVTLEPEPTPTHTITPFPTPVTLTETYTNTTAGFSIDYPADWEVEEQYESTKTVQKIIAPSGSYVEIVGVHAPNVELKQFVSARIGLDGEFMEQYRKKLDDLPGYFSEGEHVHKRNPIKILMLLNGDWAIHATFTVDELQDESTMDLMRDSFKIINP